MPQKIVAGNWKMNGLTADLEHLSQIATGVGTSGAAVSVVVCVPATLLGQAVNVANASLHIGGQDCHPAQAGAHTGDISALMLADAGASHVILGHSERRADHGEESAHIAHKVTAAWAAGLVAIVCVGETLAQREAGETMRVVEDQVRASVPSGATPQSCVIAYEPVWAIGTGLVATTDQIGEVHGALRRCLAREHNEGAEFSILYGGSVKSSNADEIFGTADVDGALVGGASLTAADFVPIVAAMNRAGT